MMDAVAALTTALCVVTATTATAAFDLATAAAFHVRATASHRRYPTSTSSLSSTTDAGRDDSIGQEDNKKNEKKNENVFASFLDNLLKPNQSKKASGGRTSAKVPSFGTQPPRPTRARDLVLSLVRDEQCFARGSGVRAFVEACASDVVYEDRYEPQPRNGRTEVERHMFAKLAQRKGSGGDVRIDKISDGDAACGYAWTWICGDQEGLRGTTYVELNEQGKIQYVQEIPEPIFKPGDATQRLLEAITRDAVPKPPQPFTKRNPTAANEVAKYLFGDLQYARDETGMDEMISFFDGNVVYRDFNFEDPLYGPAEVKQFVRDFSFPGIEFRPLRYDDGIDATCFTWEVVLDGAPPDATIQGISFYELDPETRKIVYVRDVPESAIKPPILGKLARTLRPGLGVFQGVPINSRPGGM